MYSTCKSTSYQTCYDIIYVMKVKLTIKETLFVATMLFGLFFGAGNLIFPVYMGQLAGRNMYQAVAGFLVTGVGMPLLGVAAIGITRSDGVIALASKVGKHYSIFFSCALYLTIGPFFAIPRCASVPFTVGISDMIGDNASSSIALAIFSLIFFIIVLAFSLKPSGILTWVGKILTPFFLIFLGILIIVALSHPITSISSIEPTASYMGSLAFFSGFLEGYNTMDALAALAFGIVVVDVIKGLGISSPEAIARNTISSGIFSCIIMGIIYIAITLVGAGSTVSGNLFNNGGEVLAFISHHYFGNVGAFILAATVTLACLKTAVGLITSCSEAFASMFERGPSYKIWCIIFCIIAFLVANLGLSSIIAYSLPVLMMLYPLAISLILLGLFGRLFDHDTYIYRSVTLFTFIASILDLIKALPADTIDRLHLHNVIDLAYNILPMYGLGLGWICPAAIGLVIGIIIKVMHASPSGS